MIDYKSAVLTAAPQSLVKRLEIVEAIRTLAAADDEQLRKRQEEIAALRRDLEKLRADIVELWRLCEVRARSHVVKYSPDQPRVPAGNPAGRNGPARTKVDRRAG